jgi:broad specificity phosphatase PhoE
MEDSIQEGFSLVVVRHGETVGESSIRYHGITDVVLSHSGRGQAYAARRVLADREFDLVVASPLARAWQTATVLAPDQEIHLEEDFREVDFGLWEGLTREEIAERDPDLYAEWQRNPQAFGYPGGEARAEFRSRIERGLERLLARQGSSTLLVAHKGVIRVLVAALTRRDLPPGEPLLGGVLRLARAPGGEWELLAD